LKRAAERIAPDLIQLNSLDRPAPFPGVHPLEHEELRRIADTFHPLPVHFFSKKKRSGLPARQDRELLHDIVNLLSLAPHTLNRLSVVTGVEESDLEDAVGVLADEGRLVYDAASKTARCPAT